LLDLAKNEQLAMSETRKIEQMLGYITRFRDAYPNVAGRFIDVTYRELVSDPLAVVRLYERLEIRLTDLAAERMRRLASARSRYKKARCDVRLLPGREINPTGETLA
jgi:hypothetical protein